MSKSMYFRVLAAAVAVMIFISARASGGQEAKEWIVLHNNLPENAVKFNVRLEFSPTDRTVFWQTSQEITAEALADSKKNKGYTQQINIATAINGYDYRLLLRDASDLIMLNRNSEKTLKVEIQRWKQKDKPEMFKEGYWTAGREIELPFEIGAEKLNLPVSSKVSGTFAIEIWNSGESLLKGRFGTRINGQLAGSTLMQAAALNVSLTCRDSLKIEDRVISVEIRPFDKNMQSSSANGKLTDIITIREANIAVEKIAADCSELVIAVVQGDINKSPEQPNLLTLKKPVPNFARVELIQRKLMTLDELKTQAGSQGHIVLLFGEFKENMAQGMMPGMMPPGNMAASEFGFDETIISKILQQDTAKPLMIVFVCQRLPLANLYGKWLDQKLDFLILSDFSNSLNAVVQGSYPGRNPYYNERTMAKGTLRDFFGIVQNKVAVMVIQGQGDLIYFNKDAGPQLSETLSEINSLIRK